MSRPAFLPPVPLFSRPHLSPTSPSSPPNFSPSPSPSRPRPLIRASQTLPSYSPPVPPQPSTSLLSLLRDVQENTVDTSSGQKVPFWKQVPSRTEVLTGILELRTGAVDYLNICTDRAAQAVVFGQRAVLDSDLSDVPIFVFAHGFSQRPLNYFSLLAYLAVQGYVVIAPRVWVFSVLFTDVETIEVGEGLQEKLQTALLIDTARAAQVAYEYSAKVHVLGHSMGGAMGMVYAGYASERLESVAIMAPEVEKTKFSDLNQTVGLDEEGGKKGMIKLARDMKCRMLMLHGTNDVIVKSESLEFVLKAFANAPLTGLIELVKGSHIAFEDTLEIDLPFVGCEEFLFGIIDRILFGECFNPVAKEQLESSKDILCSWTKNVGMVNEEELRNVIEAVNIPSEADYSWN